MTEPNERGKAKFGQAFKAGLSRLPQRIGICGRPPSVAELYRFDAILSNQDARGPYMICDTGATLQDIGPHFFHAKSRFTPRPESSSATCRSGALFRHSATR